MRLGAPTRSDLGAPREQIEASLARIEGNTDIGSAVADANLVIEAIPEDLAIKQSFYRALSAVAPAGAIFASNSSTLVPSQFAIFTDRPERVLNMHFAHEVWRHNIAEVMGHPGTDPAVFERVVQFAHRIGMVPLPLRKEHPGYLLNTMLMPMLIAALGLLVNDVADVPTIDKAWMIAKGDRIGPFGILDGIGMTTVYNVTRSLAERTGDPTHRRIAEYVKANLIDTGRLGKSVGRGFYHILIRTSGIRRSSQREVQGALKVLSGASWLSLVRHRPKLSGRDAPQSLERAAERALLGITEDFRDLRQTQV